MHLTNHVSSIKALLMLIRFIEVRVSIFLDSVLESLHSFIGSTKKLSKSRAVGNWTPTQQILMCECANAHGHQFAQLFASEQSFVGQYFS